MVSNIQVQEKHTFACWFIIMKAGTMGVGILLGHLKNHLYLIPFIVLNTMFAWLNELQMAR